MSVNSEYQVLLSPDPFGESSDNSYTGFSKYNSHNHLLSYPKDPRYLKVYRGDIVYALDSNGEPVFEEETIVTSLDKDFIYVSLGSIRSLSEGVVHFLDSPQDILNLDSSRKVYKASINQGSNQIQLLGIDQGSVKSEWIKDSSRFLLSGDLLISEFTPVVIVPSRILPAFRILHFQFSLNPIYGSDLQGTLEVSLRGINSQGSPFFSYPLVSPRELNSNNNYSIKEMDISESQIIPSEDGLAISIVQNNISGGSQQIIDLESYNSLNDLVLQGLSSSSGRLQYWVDLTVLGVED